VSGVMGERGRRISSLSFHYHENRNCFETSFLPINTLRFTGEMHAETRVGLHVKRPFAVVRFQQKLEYRLRF
jgi:hypothetical protein